MTGSELVTEGLARLGITCDERQLQQLMTYLAEIDLWNPKLGLVNAAGDELLIRHVLDCAAGFGPILKRLRGEVDAATPDGGSRRMVVADVGSGAGLPGIPLAILMPWLDVVLVERSGRRVGFLNNAILAIGVSNVTIAEKDVARDTGCYDAITFRAFHPLSGTLWAHLAARLRPDGFVCAYKGRRQSIDDELHALDPAALGLDTTIVPIEVPFLTEPRHLLFLSVGDSPAGTRVASEPC